MLSHLSKLSDLLEIVHWDDFNFDEWLKSATTKSRLTSTPSSFDIGDETCL